jgi:hypothetical protein
MDTINQTSHRDNVKNRITSGRYVEFRGLSICKINDFYNLRTGTKYQVHSYFFSELYEDIDEAIDKFFELRSKIARKKLNREPEK